MGTIVAKMTLRAKLGVAIVAAALVTIFGRLTAATTSPALDVAIETTATVSAVLCAILMHARYGRSGQRSDLALSAALALVAIAAAAVLVGEAMHAALPAGSPSDHAFVGDRAIAGLEAATMVLLAGAALGFARRPATAQDGLTTWFPIGAVFGCFACLTYVVDPSMLAYSLTPGDFLRLGFILCLLAGGAAEIRRARRALTVAAIEEERRRIARDLHDGTAQDLAFILHLARRLTERAARPHELRQLATAARHALDNTRRALGGTARPGDEPLASALRRTAREVAERAGARADVEGGLDVSVPPATRDALCLLVREAVTNAVRHGGARTVHVSVQDAPELRLCISDDGGGFDPTLVRQSVGRAGLSGMRQRVEGLGGDLRIRSQPGQGTEVLVVLP
jgi:signal transduction histidine kinase